MAKKKSSPLSRTIRQANDGDGFETAMEMLTQAARTIRRLEFHRARVIEQQKRAQMLTVSVL